MKAVIFDMDGVLTDSEIMHFDALNLTLGVEGAHIDFDYYKQFIGSTVAYTWTTLKRDFSLTRTLDTLKRTDAANRAALAATRGHLPVAGAVELVSQLHRRGVPLAVASGSPLAAIEEITAHFHLRDCFAQLVTGDQVAHPKPAPDIFLEAASLLGVPADQCVVIEDSENGVLAAKRAGCFCIGYRNPHSGDQDLSRADAKVDTLTALSDTTIRTLFAGRAAGVPV